MCRDFKCQPKHGFSIVKEIIQNLNNNLVLEVYSINVELIHSWKFSLYAFLIQHSYIWFIQYTCYNVLAQKQIFSIIRERERPLFHCAKWHSRGSCGYGGKVRERFHSVTSALKPATQLRVHPQSCWITTIISGKQWVVTFALLGSFYVSGVQAGLSLFHQALFAFLHTLFTTARGCGSNEG